MNYANVKYIDIANGSGVRTSLFVSGCTHRCPGCFNEEAWDFNAGLPFDEAIQQDILDSLEPSYISGLSVLGGEPFEPENQRALLPFLTKVKEIYPEKNIWVYTGDLLDDLRSEKNPRHTEATNPLLSLIDVLVDGLFEVEKKDITLKFRGSSNQRLIDLPQTLASGTVTLFKP